MAQKYVVKGNEELPATNSRQDTRKDEEMCLMAIKASLTHLVGEGKSIVRPPLFNGENYAYWKTRMRLFIQANDYDAWRVIVMAP